ncbi:MAG: phosphotransferase [Anaerolineae bacterium]|nr:phosphotransferase [Anaerolineae bacterium]
MRETLNHYLAAWNLVDPRPLAETATSHLFIVRTVDDEAAVLKLLTPLGVKDEHHGAAALRRFDGQGAVRLLQWDAGAHLLDYVEGDDLTVLVRQGGDAQATRIIAGVLNHLHRVRPETSPDDLVPLRRWFRMLFWQAEADQQRGVRSLYTQAAPLADRLLNDPREVCVLHGDIHHENIRHHARRGWLAFDPKGLYGERTFDAANALCNPVDMPELVENEARLLRNADILAGEMGLDGDRLLAFVLVYACLSASWSLEDGQNPAAALRIAALAEPHARLS